MGACGDSRDGEGLVEYGQVLLALLLGCGFKADHGALHAAVGGVAEQVIVESDVIDFGATEQAGDLAESKCRLEGVAQAGVDGKLAVTASAGGVGTLPSPRKSSRVACSS